jgi:hypothetical protein
VSLREQEVALAFDDGRESMALDVLEWLDGFHDDEAIDVIEIRQLMEALIGWDPIEDDAE